jgi:hypothetical protein
MGSCCEVRRRLAEAFAINARQYADAVVSLTRAQNASIEEYARLRDAAEKAKARVGQSGVAFEEHVDQHQCYPGAFAAGSSSRQDF